MNPQVNGQVPDNPQAPQQVPHHSNMLSLPSIERLTGRDNWSTWKFAVETFLELEELWEVVKPTLNADGTLPPIDERKCRKARGKIILLLDPTVYVHVKGVKTAREAWSKLEAAFEDAGLMRRVGLLRKLITTTLTACGSMEIYVNEIVSTAHQIRGVGFDVCEEWVGTFLLAGLPEEYKPMLMALENSGLAITGDSIKTKLLQEMHSVPEKTAFVGRKPYPPKQKPSAAQGRSAEQQPKGPKCKRCHRHGHVARDCQSRTGSAFATVLATNEGFEDDSWILIREHRSISRRIVAC
ncbi:uncharacterized protein LOC119769586 [Culex quinquefasciatus]|uniref:uncharacterized protein LOC119769586 n=1 Tax=Culex quinquefasciatus TaxID=7176 RepID=UPI0018E3358A|nr:uncharacterized protein LOC119769586 [Culex quinquefasciatus]